MPPHANVTASFDSEAGARHAAEVLLQAGIPTIRIHICADVVRAPIHHVSVDAGERYQDVERVLRNLGPLGWHTVVDGAGLGASADERLAVKLANLVPEADLIEQALSSMPLSSQAVRSERGMRAPEADELEQKMAAYRELDSAEPAAISPTIPEADAAEQQISAYNDPDLLEE